MSLSLCMIVKNEEQNLPRCLTSIQGYVDEIIVADTGSEDASPEICRSFGAKVLHFPWRNDFAAARNFAISYATQDWILVLDADEEWMQGDINLSAFLKSQPPEIFLAGIFWGDAYDIHHMYNGFYPRILRCHPSIRYKGRIHEQPVYEGKPIPRTQVAVVPNNTWICHWGNGQGNEAKKQRERYIPMMEAIEAEEGLSLMLLHFLATAYDRDGHQDSMQRCCEKAEAHLLPYLLTGESPPDFEWVASWLYALGKQYIQKQNDEMILLICQRSIVWCPDFPPLIDFIGCVLIYFGFALGAIPYLENSLQLCQNILDGKQFSLSVPIYETFNLKQQQCKSLYNLACAHEILQNWDKVRSYLQVCLQMAPEFQPAQEKLQYLGQKNGNC